jgi:hypothetical protein
LTPNKGQKNIENKGELLKRISEKADQLERPINQTYRPSKEEIAELRRAINKYAKDSMFDETDIELKFSGLAEAAKAATTIKELTVFKIFIIKIYCQLSRLSAPQKMKKKLKSEYRKTMKIVRNQQREILSREADEECKNRMSLKETEVHIAKVLRIVRKIMFK